MQDSPVQSRSGRPPTAIDLFAAPGGLSEGFREAGYRILAQVDNDKWGCETLFRNFGLDGTFVIEANIEKLRLHANVDVVIGGPPCQGFSQVGRPKINHLRKAHNRKRFIDYKRNRLYKQFVKIVASVKPQFFVMENVPGMVTIAGGRIGKQILADFKKVGYETDVRILKAADHGIPQIRRRAVFIGNRIGAVNSFPIKTHFDRSMDKERHDANQLSHYVTVSDAISDLPPLDPGKGEDETEYPSTSNLTEYQKRARMGSLKLYNHVARMHSTRDRDIFRMLRQGEKMVDLPEHDRPYRWDIFGDKIKKQSWTGQSRAIVAHMQKDGLMFVHPDDNQARTFTPREAARIQSFRDKFRFYGPMTQQFRQIGNAVPPLLSWSIAMSIRSLLKSTTPPVFGYRLVETPLEVASS